MDFVILVGVLITGFIIFGGAGKMAMKLFDDRKINVKLAKLLISGSMVLWLITAFIVITLIAFNIATWLGWVVGITMLLWLIFEALPSNARDTQHSIDLVRERRNSQ